MDRGMISKPLANIYFCAVSEAEGLKAQAEITNSITDVEQRV